MNNWKEFERDVLQTLSLQGWKVENERLIGHKKVDGYAEKFGEFNQRQKIAIECKNYKNPITQKQVSEIYSNYLPLIQKNNIDYVLLVTLEGLHPSAETFVKDANGLVHISYVELVNSAINLSSYASVLIDQYQYEALEQLYIDQEFIDSSENRNDGIANVVLEWASDSSSRPLAILGGYGIGKSTLAKRISYLLAQKYLEDPRNRIPILINLEELQTEQSVEGLLGTHFTSHFIVQNYNFHLFMKLNDIGRFVVILDGFDEMKKSMSWESMRFNFQQLNRLVTLNSKVILLGRPTAFFDEDEQIEALHGRRKIQSVEKRIPGWPDYVEYYLLPFSKEKVILFIKKYEDYLYDEYDRKTDKSPFKILLDSMNRNSNENLKDLSNRPVQLKMLMDILPEYEGPLDKITTTILYSEFIDLVIRREVSKKARMFFSTEERRRFASKIAFWMWKNDIGTQVSTTRLPEELFSEFYKHEISRDAARRDLLSGCFLERKPPDGLYFPHRSFMEFLIAEHLILSIKERGREILEIQYISAEIEDFFVQLLGIPTIKEWLAWLLSVDVLPDSVTKQCLDLYFRVCSDNGILNHNSIVRKFGITSPSSRPNLPRKRSVSDKTTTTENSDKSKSKRKISKTNNKDGVSIRPRSHRIIR